MKSELKKTDTVDNHKHIVYLKPDGTGITSVNNDHNHLATINEADGSWILDDGPGHMHQVFDYEVTEKNPSPDKVKVVNEVIRDLGEAIEYESKSRKKGYESEQMYAHDQWDQNDIADLQSKNRAALTINRLEEKCDNLSGYQRQNRTEIRFLPTPSGDPMIADILNIVVKNSLNQCFYQREKSKVFEDAMIPGRGLFHIYEDYERNIEGDIIVEKFPWDECYFLPYEKEDLSDCDGIIKAKWFSESKIKEMFPDVESMQPETKEMMSRLTKSEDWDKRVSENDLVDYNAKKYRLLERIRKEYKRSYILVNADDDFVFSAEGWNRNDVKTVKTIPGFTLIERLGYKLKSTKIVGTVFIEEDYLEDKDFPIVPVHAKKRNGTFWGKIEGVKDLQRLINKTYSQFIDIIAKMSNWGYYYDSNTFPTKKLKEEFKNNASSPGFVQEVTNVNAKPVREEGVKFPTELTGAIEIFSNNMHQIMNVNLEMMGLNQGAKSGVAIRQKIVQQLLGNDFLFDNMTFAEQLLGRVFVRKVQKMYSSKRMLRILQNQAQKEMFELQGKPFADYDPGFIENLLSNADLTQYDVEIGESPASPSVMMGNFLMLLEMAGSGVQVPPEAILEFAPIPNKSKIMEAIKAQQEQAAAMEQKKYQTEIDKAKIAQMGKTMGQAEAEPLMQTATGVAGANQI